METGDIGLLPGRAGFVLASDPALPPVDVPLATESEPLSKIGTGADCTVLAGRVSLHASSEVLLTSVLPAYVILRASSPRAASLRWILEELLQEQTSTLPGSGVATAQLAQLFFTQVLRARLAGAESLPRGWLRALTDDRIVRALRLIHENPKRGWTLAELAKAAGMSRTRFAVHFADVAGISPIGYLAEWRMRLAQRMLRDGDAIAEIAESLGYASESAFSNAFKRIIGLAPRHYRDATRA